MIRNTLYNKANKEKWNKPTFLHCYLLHFFQFIPSFYRNLYKYFFITVKDTFQSSNRIGVIFWYRKHILVNVRNTINICWDYINRYQVIINPNSMSAIRSIPYKHNSFMILSITNQDIYKFYALTFSIEL